MTDAQPDPAPTTAVTALGAKEAKQATNTIPIVFVLDPDPVGSGLVESLARPGGNATGLSLMSIDMSGKRLGLFKELVPNLPRIAIMVDPRDAPRSRCDGCNIAIRYVLFDCADAIRGSSATALMSPTIASPPDLVP